MQSPCVYVPTPSCGATIKRIPTPNFAPIKYPLSLLYKVVKPIITSDNGLSEEEIAYFNDYIVPAKFKDDRYGIKDLGLEKTNKLQSYKEMAKIMQNMRIKMIFLFENFLGVQYATFGAFMKRYGLGGMTITKILIPKLVNKYNNVPFNITKNVKEMANTAFYMVQGGHSSLEKYNSSDNVDFIVKYLKEISGVESNTLGHSDNEDDKDMQYKNLMSIVYNIIDIMDTNLELVHIDALSDANISRMSEMFR